MTAHAEFLRAASGDEALARQVKADFRRAGLPEADRRMLEFAEKLTLMPWAMARDDVDGLRRAGFGDVEILQIVLGCAHFNYLNRVADGIGIRLEYASDLPAFSPLEAGAKDVPALPEPPAPVSKEAAGWIDFGIGGDGGPEEPRNLYRVMGGNPEAAQLAREWRAFQLAATPGLDAVERARIALFISGSNRCDYSARWLARRLTRLGDDEGLVSLLARGEVPTDLPRRARLLFEHAARLTHRPWTTRESHIAELRAAGLDDTAVLQHTMLASYLSFENRVALGLGAGLE